MYRITLLAICLGWLSTATALGQIDSLEINGPREVRPGQLVVITAETHDEETPFWIVLRPSQLDYQQVDGGHRLIFAAGCQSGQTITVLLLAQQVHEGRIVTRQLRRSIEVRSPTPPVAPLPSDPAPDPPDKPNEGGRPTPPDTPVPDWTASPAFTAVKNALPLIASDPARRLGARVADNLDLVANRCRRGGEIKTIPEIAQQLSQLNRVALADQTTAWAPVGAALQQTFLELKLPSVSAHPFHLRAAALAIRQGLQSPPVRMHQPFVRDRVPHLSPALSPLPRKAIKQ